MYSRGYLVLKMASTSDVLSDALSEQIESTLVDSLRVMHAERALVVADDGESRVAILYRVPAGEWYKLPVVERVERADSVCTVPHCEDLSADEAQAWRIGELIWVSVFSLVAERVGARARRHVDDFMAQSASTADAMQASGEAFADLSASMRVAGVTLFADNAAPFTPQSAVPMVKESSAVEGYYRVDSASGLLVLVTVSHADERGRIGARHLAYEREATFDTLCGRQFVRHVSTTLLGGTERVCSHCVALAESVAHKSTPIPSDFAGARLGHAALWLVSHNGERVAHMTPMRDGINLVDETVHAVNTLCGESIAHGVLARASESTRCLKCAHARRFAYRSSSVLGIL